MIPDKFDAQIGKEGGPWAPVAPSPVAPVHSPVLDFDGWLSTQPESVRSAASFHLNGIADPAQRDTEKKRLGAMAWAADTHALPIDRVAQDWDLIRGGISEQEGWDDAKDDEGRFFEKVTHKVRKQESTARAYQSAADEGAAAALAEGQNYSPDVVPSFSSWQSRMTAGWKPENAENDGYSPFDAARHRETYDTARAATRKKLELVRPILDSAWSVLWQNGQTESDSGNREVTPSLKDLMRVASELEALPSDQRETVMQAIAGRLAIAEKGGDQGVKGGLGKRAKFTLDRAIATLISQTMVETPNILAGKIPGREGQQSFAATIQDLRDLREGRIVPIKADGFIESGVIGAVGSLPQMVAMSVPGGQAALFSAYQSDAFEQIRRHRMEQGWSREDAAKDAGSYRSTVAAAVNTVATSVLGLSATKLPSLTKWASGLAKSGAAKIALGITGTYVSEASEEFATQAMPLLFTDLVAAVDKDVPGIDGEALKQDLTNAAPDILATTLIFALIGGGASGLSMKDAPGTDADKVASLRGLGIDAATAAEMVANPEKFKKAWEARNPTPEAAAAVQAERAAAVQEAAATQQTGPTRLKFDGTGNVIVVDNATGETVGQAQNAADALALARAHQADANTIIREGGKWTVRTNQGDYTVESEQAAQLLRSDLALTGSQEVADSFVREAEAWQSLATAESPRRAEFRAEAFQATKDTDGNVSVTAQSPDGAIRDATGDYDAGGIQSLSDQLDTLSSESRYIAGSNFRQAVADGAAELVVRINRGADLSTWAHESIEANFKDGLNDGSITRDGIVSALRSAFPAMQRAGSIISGRAQKGRLGDASEQAQLHEALSLPERIERILSDPEAATDADLREAVVEIAVADAIGRDRDGGRHRAGSIMASIRDAARATQSEGMNPVIAFMRAVRNYFRGILMTAQALRQARKKGELNQDYTDLIEKITGTDGRSYVAGVRQAVETSSLSLKGGLREGPMNKGLALDLMRKMAENHGDVPLGRYHLITVRSFSVPNKAFRAPSGGYVAFTSRALRSSWDSHSFRAFAEESWPFPGEFVRATNDPKDIEYLQAGTHKGSINHATKEPENGLSVAYAIEIPAEYAYFLAGTQTGAGTDGEPLLDPRSAKATSPLLSYDEAKARIDAAGQRTYADLYPTKQSEMEITEQQLRDAGLSESETSSLAPTFSLTPMSPRQFTWNEIDDEYLYHITTTDRLDDIEAHGLRPGARGQFSGAAAIANSVGRLFFTERSGVKVWVGVIEDQLDNTRDYDDDEESIDDIAVLRLPRDMIKGLQPDDPKNSPVKEGRDFYTEIPATLGDSPSFSLTPSSRIDLIAQTLNASLRGKDNAMTEFLARASTNLHNLKGRYHTLPEPRTKTDLDREQSSMVSVKRAELEDTYVGQVQFEQGGILEQPELAKLTEQPLIDQLRTSRSARLRFFEGRLMPRRAWERRQLDAGRDIAGDYDGADGIPSMFFRGNETPDQLAQELFELGQITAPTPDALFDGIRATMKATSRNSDRLAKATAELRAAQHKARDEAKAHGAEWRKERDAEQRVLGGDRGQLLRDAQTVDAIIAALPPEVRGKLKFLASDVIGKKTDAAFAGIITERLRAVEIAMTKFRKSENSASMRDLMLKGTGKLEPGKKREGTAGVAVHDYFGFVSTIVEMNEVELAGQRAIISLQASGVDAGGQDVEGWEEPTPDEELRLAWQLQAIDQWGNFQGLSLEAQNAALIVGWDYYRTGRSEWLRQESERIRVQRENTTAGVLALGQGTYERLYEVNRERKKLKKLQVELRDFEGFITALFGPDHALTTRWSEQVRQGFATRDKALQALRRRFTDHLATIWPELSQTKRRRKLYDIQNTPKIRLELQEIQESEEFLTMTHDQRGEALASGHQFETVTSRVHLTEDEGLFILLTAAQERYLPALEAAGWTAEVLKKLDAMVSPEAKALGAFYIQELADQHAPLNEVFMRIRGIRLPQTKNYFPGRFFSNAQEQEAASSPAFGYVGKGFADGFLRDRKDHLARVKPESASRVFWRHMNTSTHWAAMAEPVREMRNSFRRPQIKAALKGQWGDDGMTMLEGWFAVLEGNGAKPAGGKANTVFAQATSLFAQGRLVLSAGTLFKNASAAFNVAWDMPFGAFLSGAGKFIRHPGQYYAVFQEIRKSDIIRRRLENGVTPEVQVALDSFWQAKPGYGQALMEKGFNLIGGVDAFTASFGAVAAYEFHSTEAEKLGMNPELIHTYAMRRVEQTIDRTSQPQNVSRKSLLENTQTGLAQWALLFASEGRQKAVLAMRSLYSMKGKTKSQKAGILARHAILGIVLHTMGAMVRDWRDGDDDDDDRNWEWTDFIIAALAGPLNGIPIVGAGIDAMKDKTAGRRVFDPDSSNAILSPVYSALGTPVDMVNDLWDDQEQTAGDEAKKLIRGMRGVGGLPGVVGNVLDQLMDTWDLVDDEDERGIND